MVSVEKAVIAKLIKSGEKFEILVDPEKALEVKTGKDVDIYELLAAQEVYEDVKKGLRVEKNKLNKTFGTNDMVVIAKRIIREGEVQLTTEQRKQMLEERKKSIANIIAKRGINPQTNTPHPVERILRVMDEAKVRIDIEKNAEEQVDGVLKSIQPIIPIKFEKMQIAIKVPPEFAGKTSNVMRSFGTLLREEWKSDRSYLCLLEIPAGLQQDVYDRLNNLTHGKNEVKIVKKEW